jgi:hypothetical protein
VSETTAGGLLWDALDEEGRKSQLIAMTKRASEMSRQVESLTKQLAEAQNALLKYGDHAGGCSFNGPYSIGEAHVCDCGWKEIKRAAAGGDRE